MEEIQTQGNNNCNKLLRIGSKIGQKGGELYQDEDEEDGEEKANVVGGCGDGGGGGGGEDVDQGGRSLRAWYSSRIHRVSRTAGGKDRHSKVLTAKGLRDRRVRLSVSTAIQFYDLQDRLGYDQPSKAVEWLIKAATDAISELPTLESKFPSTPKQLSDEKRSSPSDHRQAGGFDAAEMELDMDEHSFQHPNQQQHLSLSKSACSSTSETSKGSSVLSLSRSQSRVKARERARERTAKVDTKEQKLKDEPRQSHHITPPQNHQQSPHHNSFTELLTGCGAAANSSCHQNNSSPTAATSAQQNHHHFVLRAGSMDYFNSMSMGLFGQSSSSSSSRLHLSSAGLIPSQTLFGIAPTPHMQQQQQQQPFSSPEMQHFSFIPDQLISDGADYNLNFSISSGGLAGNNYNNRGTLQSNSTPSPMSHHHHHHLHQRLFSSADGPNMTSFSFMGASTPAPTSSADQNQFPAGCDGRLQLCYGGDNNGRHSDLKGKGKN
ncbi:hypothetical protein Scep_027484 [Stephania cephalantha]|uniref:CINCINNATA1 n=1 Tax=Stephania cephalantha TaxID=152367 RepID=A0AAP0EBH2_9MAGN